MIGFINWSISFDASKNELSDTFDDKYKIEIFKAALDSRRLAENLLWTGCILYIYNGTLIFPKYCFIIVALFTFYSLYLIDPHYAKTLLSNNTSKSKQHTYNLILRHMKCINIVLFTAGLLYIFIIGV